MKVDNSSQLLQLLLMSQLLGSASGNSSENQGFQSILNTVLGSMNSNGSSNSSLSSSANQLSGLSALSGLGNLSASDQGSLMNILSEMSAINTVNELGSTDSSDDGSDDNSGGFNLNGLNLNGLSGLNLSQMTGGSSYQNQQLVNSFISGIKNDASSGNITIDQAVENAAKKYGVDKNLIMAVINQESSFNPNATSSCGAMGLMQLMPDTASGLGVTNAYDVQQNVDGGTKYLKNLLDMYGNCKELALAAYNAGPNALARKQVDSPSEINKLSSETRNYVSKIMKYYENE